jgi:hypothetical protein
MLKEPLFIWTTKGNTSLNTIDHDPFSLIKKENKVRVRLKQVLLVKVTKNPLKNKINVITTAVRNISKTKLPNMMITAI